MFAKRISLAFAFALASSTLLAPGLATAHAALKTSSPTNGAVLAKAPKTFDLEFGHPAKLTRFRLTKESKEIALPIDREAAASTTFKIPLPALQRGKYEARWSTLGEDGHAMTGSVSFTVSGE